MKDVIKAILLFLLIVGAEIAIGCLLSWLICDINPAKTYHWTGGIWHGCFFLPNLVRSIFTDALFKAENYTTGYNVFWWIFTIISCLGVVSSGRRRD